MKINALILFGLFPFFGCNNDAKTQTVNIDNIYSMELPDFLINNNVTNEKRSLQYRSDFDELYIHVIDQSISNFNIELKQSKYKEKYNPDLEGYSKVCLENYKEGFDVMFVSEPEKTSINGLPAISYILRVKEDSGNIYCRFVLIQGRELYYKLVVFTLETFENDNKENMEKMIKSFKEI